MQILVTGGAGFIGSHLVNKLIQMKEKVIAIDNLTTGKKENIKHQAPNCIFIKGDITDKKFYERIPNNINVIFHLAALTHVADSIQKAELCFNTNITGSFKILEFCRKKDVEKIVFTSSAAVYGNHNKPVKEDSICKPISLYGKYKLFVEELIKGYCEIYGISYTIYRLFNVYGPRASAGVIKSLIECTKSRKPFYLYGDGKQKRDFVFVEDVVDILCQHNKLKNITLNVGTGKTTTILGLIKLFKNLTKSNFKIIKKRGHFGDIKISCADTTNFKKFFPKVKFIDLKNGILKTFYST